MGTYRLICNLFENLIINYELFNNFGESINYCRQIISYDNLNNCPSNTIKTLKKMAELNIIIGQKTQASENFLECAKKAITSDLLRFRVKNYLLYSLILILDEKTEVEINNKITEYTNIFPVFSNSPEQNMFLELQQAYNNHNKEFINQVIVNNKNSFDNCMIKVLEQIKNNIN
jgi:hypothetical protein